jgi:uncharacterized protein YggE
MSESTNDTGGGDVTRSQRESTHRSLRATQWIIMLVAVLVVAGVGLVGVALGHSQSTPKGNISVTGSGTVQGTPDTVSFQIGVQNVATSAAQALSANNARVAALENSLLGHGVAQKDMQTSGLDIYENTNNQGAVTGFTVVDDLNVTMHQIGNAGAAIDAAVHAAGNGVELDGVTFSISNESKLLAAARAKAMQNARTEASQVASGGNASLGAIEKITDQENSTSNVFPYSNFQASGLTASVPLKAGSQSINVQVSVVYALND